MKSNLILILSITLSSFGNEPNNIDGLWKVNYTKTIAAFQKIVDNDKNLKRRYKKGLPKEITTRVKYVSDNQILDINNGLLFQYTDGRIIKFKIEPAKENTDLFYINGSKSQAITRLNKDEISQNQFFIYDKQKPIIKSLFPKSLIGKWKPEIALSMKHSGGGTSDEKFLQDIEITFNENKITTHRISRDETRISTYSILSQYQGYAYIEITRIHKGNSHTDTQAIRINEKGNLLLKSGSMKMELKKI